MYTSKYRKVRIYQVVNVSEKSKKWAVTGERLRRAGVGYCPGQYPPALAKFTGIIKPAYEMLDPPSDYRGAGEDRGEGQGGEAEAEKAAKAEVEKEGRKRAPRASGREGGALERGAEQDRGG